MSDSSLPNKDPTSELVAHYANILANFKERMSLNQAERTYSMHPGELRVAIDNGWCRYYKRGSRYQVCHQFIAEYIEKHCISQCEELPS